MKQRMPANKNICPADIHSGKEYQQQHQPSTKVPDVLRLQPFKLYGFVNAFVDLKYTVAHYYSLI